MDKKGPWKNGSQRTKHQADLSIPNDAELESSIGQQSHAICRLACILHE